MQHHVDTALVRPLIAQDRATPKFSRSSPPSNRRARITATSPATDAKGNAFLTFALDSRWGKGDWQDDMTGCVYVNDGTMYLAFGSQYQPAAVVLGKDGDPAPDVCKAVSPSPSS
jgi:hypothetical protein